MDTSKIESLRRYATRPGASRYVGIGILENAELAELCDALLSTHPVEAVPVWEGGAGQSSLGTERVKEIREVAMMISTPGGIRHSVSISPEEALALCDSWANRNLARDPYLDGLEAGWQLGLSQDEGGFTRFLRERKATSVCQQAEDDQKESCPRQNLPAHYRGGGEMSAYLYDGAYILESLMKHAGGKHRAGSVSLSSKDVQDLLIYLNENMIPRGSHAQLVESAFKEGYESCPCMPPPTQQDKQACWETSSACAAITKPQATEGE